MADDLTRLQASRKAYKSHVTRLYRKIDDAFETDVDDYTITTMKTAIDQLNTKKEKIAELHEKIFALIDDADELTETMVEAGELEDSITDKVAKALRFIELQSTRKRSQSNPTSESNPINQPPVTDSSPPQLLSANVQPTDIVSTQPLETSTDLVQVTSPIASSNSISSIVSLTSTPTVSTVTTLPLYSTPPLLLSVTAATNSTMNFYSEPLAPRTLNLPRPHTSASQLLPTIPGLANHVHVPSQSSTSRLPKLTIPVFSGDPLNWQTFWDLFSAAIHTNPALGCIQKFNYLKAQLQGDAARAIAGLPLTECKYQHSIEL